MQMLKTFKKIILAQIVLLFIFVGGIPASVYGQAQNQTIGDYVLLVPNLPGIDGNTTTLDKYIPAAINLAIGIAAGMAFVVITFGGVTYATTDALGGKQKGREMIENAVVGLLLVIGAYAILYTINPQMLAFNLDIKAARISTTPSIMAGTGVPMTQQELAQDLLIRNNLEQAGVNINNSNPCVNGETKGCTNVNGLTNSAVLGLTNLKQTCNCNLTITGGTEGGHKTHGQNKSIVDLRPTNDLNSFLGVNTPREGLQITKTLPNGRRGVFTFEKEGGNSGGTSTGDHWHVIFE